MRILILFSSSELGGAERSLSRMALASTKVDYQLATIRGEGPWCDWIRQQGMQPLIFGTNGLGMLGAMVRIFRYLRLSQIDVIYVCGVRASFWLRLSRWFLPHIIMIHGVRWNPNSNSRLDYFFRFVERKTGFLVDGWITNSNAARTSLIKRCGISSDRIHVIYNGIDAIPKYSHDIDFRPLEILTVANLSPRKGHREYLQVIKAVISRVPKARFVFIGRDDMNGAVQQAIKDAGLDSYISFEGFQADIAPWLKRARLLVLPSLWNEGCPTCILEAMAHGLPVVSFAIDGIPELIDQNEDGILIHPGDYLEMENTIVKLLTEPALLTKLGKAGNAKVANRFGIEHASNEHAKVIKVLLEKDRR
jgi:glycosyltransferase involved in cell wall biosynthesis